MAVGTSRTRMRPVLPAFIFSVALSLAVVCGSKVVSNGGLRVVGFGATHLLRFGWIDIVWGLLLTAVFTAITAQTPRLYRWLRERDLRARIPADSKQGRLLQLVATGVIAGTWLPALLTYAPGGVNPDALFSIKQALYAGSSRSWDNHHPVTYALFLRLWLSIGTALHSVQLGVFIACIVQFLIMAAVCGYSIAWLVKKGVPVVFVVLATLFFALFPAFALYASELSQDSLFAALVLLYSLHLIDVIQSDGELLKKVGGGATFAMLSLLIIFCRNNGILVVICAGVALILLYRMRVKPLYALLTGVLAFTVIVQGPVYTAFKVDRPIVEALAIPLQQVAYVEVTGGAVPQKDQHFLNGLLPADRWRLAYAPACVDPLKGDPYFNSKYLSDNRGQAAKTWLSLLSKNPGAYSDAYLLETFGYWKPVVGTWPGLPLAPIVNNHLGIHRSDLIAHVTGRSLAPFYKAFTGSHVLRATLNIGLTVWLAFLSAAVLVMLRKPKYLLGLIPCVGSWLGFMAAAPIAFAYRYLLMFVFCVPLFLLLPLIALREKPVMPPDAVGTPVCEHDFEAPAPTA